MSTSVHPSANFASPYIALDRPSHERCQICGTPAVVKVEEVIARNDPNQMRHPLSAYLCNSHADYVLGTRKKHTTITMPQEAMAALERLRNHHDYAALRINSTPENRASDFDIICKALGI